MYSVEELNEDEPELEMLEWAGMVGALLTPPLLHDL